MHEAAIMIVEDQRTAAGAMRTRLQGLGYSVTAIVTDGEAAVDKAQELNPDLILMDIRLGSGIDGIEAARRIHETSDIPVVFISAYVDEDLLERAHAARPAGIINKPFTTKDLLTSIDLALNNPHAIRALSGVDVAVPQDPEPAPEIVFTADTSGRITYANRAAEEFIGAERKDLIGTPLAAVLDSVYAMGAHGAEELVRSVLEQGRPVATGQTEAARNDSLTPLTDAHGHRFGVALKLRRAATGARSAPVSVGTGPLKDACERLPVGMLLVTENLEVRFNNESARRVIQDGRGLADRDGVLAMTDPRDQMILERLVRAATAGNADTPLAAFAVSAPAGLSRIDIAVAAAADRSADEETLAALYLFDATTRVDFDGGLLRDVYGFTETETTLVMHLAAGASLEEAADDLGIKLNTARTHLKHVFQKTGVKRQSELLQRLGSGPAGLLRPPASRLH